MSDLLAIITPNKALSKKTMATLVGVQVASFGLLWLFSPFVFLPTPTETLNAFAGLWADGIAVDMMTSFMLNVQAIALGLVISLFLAYATVVPMFRPVVAFLSKLRFLSLAGLTFFFTLMTSSGHELKLWLLIFSISIFFITSMADVLASIPKTTFDLSRTLRMGELRVTWEVVILGQFDKVFDVLRQNAAISWLMLSMVEGMSRSEGGVGALLLNQNKHFHLSAVMAIQIMILLTGLGQDYVIGLCKNLFCPYAKLTTEAK